MRNLSLISILLALVIGAVIWQKQLDTGAPERLPDPTDYMTTLDGSPEDEDLSEDCDENDAESSGCESNGEMTEQGEMQDQRRRAYGTMMKSFDEDYSKYRDQVRGK